MRVPKILLAPTCTCSHAHGERRGKRREEGMKEETERRKAGKTKAWRKKAKKNGGGKDEKRRGDGMDRR